MVSLRVLVLLLVAGAAFTGSASGQCVVDDDCFLSCFVNARCVDGACIRTPRVCDDGDRCTVDRCDVVQGCVSDPLCPDDGLVCNGLERCFAPIGSPPICIAGSPPDCDDHDACTVDGPCAEPARPEISPCPRTPLDCNDGNPCTTDSCAPASGCLHEAITGCCRSGADCQTDVCTIRLCVSGTCSSPRAVSCDDGDPGTIDGCIPATGCTHTPSGTATTTTLPSGVPCVSDADCSPDDEPCTVEVCDAGACVARPLVGLEALTCVCRRSDPAACAGSRLPRSVGAARTQACTLIQRAATNAKKARKLIGRGGKLLAKARRRVAHAKQVSPGCREALSALLADGVARASTARSQL